ncbi:MAG TPA: DNA recombination protein RmuC [Usitatibacter sp.]|nr:DNA recombination protein RmuC [Usitatibacter sp.]
MILLGVLAVVAGFVAGRFFGRSVRDAKLIGELEAQLAATREQSTRSSVQAAELEREITGLRSHVQEMSQRSAQLEERARMLGDSKQVLENAFKSLSAEALKNNNAAFLDLAKTSLGQFQQRAEGDLEKRQVAIDALVKPVKESLEKVHENIHALERVREQAYGEIRAQFSQMGEVQALLRQETANLVKALRAPHVRGRWGEMQLRRVVEMSGMMKHVDFVEQESADSDEGRLRPDLIVRMPGGRQIVVDAKAPINSYLDAHEAIDDNVRRAKLREHAQLVRSHLQSLSRKAYWDQFQPTPEMVVMFIPGEAFYSAALEVDPELLDNGFALNVIMASPASLMALLKAAHYGWRQESLVDNAREISRLGADLYSRLNKMSEHVSGMGRGLEAALASYNAAVGSLESRVLVSARRFKELGATSQDAEIFELRAIEGGVRRLQPPEE